MRDVISFHNMKSVLRVCQGFVRIVGHDSRQRLNLVVAKQALVDGFTGENHGR